MRISIRDIKAIHSSARALLIGKLRSVRPWRFCLVLAILACATILSVSSFAQSNPLNFGDNFFVTGDYIVAGAHGMTTTFSNGYAVGTFTIPDANPGIHGITSVPPGAEIVAALLYWQTVENAGSIPGHPGTGEDGFFRPLITGGPAAPGYPITGVPLPGQNEAVTWSSGGCSEPQEGKITRTYRANVLGSFPQNAQGYVQTSGQFEVRLPSTGPQTPLTLGATLVIIYRVLSPNVPLNSIVIYDGAYGQNSDSLVMKQTVQGFYDAATSPVSKVTLIAGAGESNKSQTVYLNNEALPSHAGSGLPPFPAYYGSWDNPTWTFGNPSYSEIANPVLAGAASATVEVLPSGSKPGCLSWGAVIVSTTVNEPDGDGLLYSWKKAGGYCDASINGGVCSGRNTDPAWVALPGATAGHKDLFIQLDYMCSKTIGVDSCTTGDGTNYSFDPRPSGAGTLMTNAFLSHGVYVHINPAGTIQPVHAIEEQSCADVKSPELALCPFPDQAGVVGWKGGYSYFKNQLVETIECVGANCFGSSDKIVINCLAEYPPSDCQPRFQHGRKDSWHYALFAHAVGRAEWKIQDSSLTSVVQSGHTVTFTTSAPLPSPPLPTLIDAGYNNHGVISTDPYCKNGRVSAYYAATNTNLNGTFCITSSTADSFTITVPGPSVSETYTLATDPYLSVAPGQTSSASGISDVGGADSLITLGLWGDPTLASSNGRQENTIAGTFMHETGHSLGLTHGGFYYDQAAGNYTPTIEPNCKPNFQSVMNYDFQVDLLNGTLDYSEQQLDPLDEASLPAGVTYEGGQPKFPSTKWYSPTAPSGTGSAVTYYCNGTPATSKAYLVPGLADPASPEWTKGTSQDLDFDGVITSMAPYLRGYSDWAPGGTAATGITTGIDLRQIGATGNISVFNQDNFFGGGAPLNGGGAPLNGGGAPLNGGGAPLNGGGAPLNGGGAPLNGGGAPLNGGGEINQQTADSYTRPPTLTGATEGTSPRTITLTWLAPTFGQIGIYKLYRSEAGGAFIPVTLNPANALTGNPPPLTYTDTVNCDSNGYRYFVTAVLSSTSTNPGQESVPSNIVTTSGSTGEPLTGCYTNTAPGTVALNNLAFTDTSSANTPVQGDNISITWSLSTDDTGLAVTRTAANTALVAIGPIPYDGACSTIPPEYLGYSGTYPYTVTPLTISGTGPFSAMWNTTNFNAGCYFFELDLDSHQYEQSSALTLLIYESDSTPHFLTTTLPAAPAGFLYSNTIQEAGGVGLLTWSYTGTLPPGLSFSNGTLSGTPTTAGTYSFTVKVTDSLKNFGTQTFSLTVIFLSDSAAPTVNTMFTPGATVGTAYGNPLIEAGGIGTITWSITSGSLPPGLTFNTSTGKISGTATAAGLYPFTVQVKDSASPPNIVAVPFTLAVFFLSDKGVPTVSTAFAPAAVQGTSYSNTISASGGTGTVTTTAPAASLPPGLLFSNGTLSGIPTTSGLYNFTVTATDSSGDYGTQQFSIAVFFLSDSSSSVNTTFTPAATQGTSYSNAIYSSGGAGTITTTVAPASLPPGLSFSNGTLSGTPTAYGLYNFTVTATDSAGDYAAEPFSIVVYFLSDSNPPTISTTFMPAATVGTPYTNTIDESGGTPQFTWSIPTGALPPGLSLGPNSGTVSGTPTAPGNYSFTAQVSDSSSPPNVATQAFMLSVADAQYGDLIVVDGSPSVNPLAGTLFRVTPTGTSGTIAAISNGTPSGVAVDAKSGSIYVAVDANGPNNGTARVVKVDPFGNITDPFVPAGTITNPVALAVDASGNVYVGDNSTNAIYEFTKTGAQVANEPFAQLPIPNSPNHIRMAFDSSGNLDVASDNIGGEVPGIEVDQIAPTGTVTVLYNTTTKSTATYALTAVNASAAITNFAISSNVVTFQAVNNFTAGTMVQISGLTVGTYLNGQVLTVLSAGLSGTQFEANFTNADVASTADSGAATAQTASYSGTFSPPLPAGSYVTISGFTNNGNNGGPFTVVSCSSNLLVVNNPNGVSETNPATATFQLTKIGTVGGIAVLPDSSIDVAAYDSEAIYNITNPGAANMAITTAISAGTAINPPLSPLCCNISGMANPPSGGANTNLYVTLAGANSAQLQLAVPQTSSVTTVNFTYSLTQANASSGGNTTYSGNCSPLIPAGSLVTISGFTNGTNNGTFAVVSCTNAALVVNNPNGIAETPATAGIAMSVPLTYPNDVGWYSYGAH